MQTRTAVTRELKDKTEAFARQLVDELEKSGDWWPNMRRFYVGIVLPPAQNQRMVSVQIVWKVQRTSRGSAKLNNDDWEFILSLPWTEGQRRVIVKLARQNNDPIHSDEISSLLGRPFPYGGATVFNAQFYKIREDKKRYYSLLRVSGIRTPEGDLFRIFKMDPRSRKPNFF